MKMEATMIKKVTAREIIASNGFPTVEALVKLEDGSEGRASVPFGSSAGSHEASVHLDEDERFQGRGAQEAVNHIVATIGPRLEGMDAGDQRIIDETMIALDGTDRKERFGGNAILAVSLAVAKAAAVSDDVPLYQHIRHQFNVDVPASLPLPRPMAVSIEGGKHAHNSTDIQEYCLTAINPAMDVAESLRAVLESYHELKKLLEADGLSTNVGNEGAFAPEGIEDNTKPLEYLTRSIEAAGYEPGVDIGIAIDAAASEFYRDGEYYLSIESDDPVSVDSLLELYTSWMEEFPIVSYEDMFAEDDWEAWQALLPLCREHEVELIGDDLTVTNTKRLQMAIERDAISAILIKLNQIGTLTETVDACKLARDHQMHTVPSHRGGGETTDTSMIDLAVAVGSSFVKVGPTRGERTVKYNRLLEIAAELVDQK